jgi:imidazolonepropionase-like amidohydrolase
MPDLTRVASDVEAKIVDGGGGPIELQGVTLLDGSGHAPRQGATVRIERGLIALVSDGPADERPDATVINGTGLFAMPGFIDAHVHLTGQRDTDPYRRYLATPSEVLLINALTDAIAILGAGFTSVRDCGLGSPALALRRLVESGVIVGPTLAIAHRSLSELGGACDWHYLPLDMVEGLQPRGVMASGPEQFVAEVRRNFREGATFTKLMVTGGNLDLPRSFPPRTSIRPEEIRATAETTHSLGGICAAHCIGSVGVRAAVEAGVDTIEHGVVTDDWAVLDLMAERGTILVPTLSIFHLMATEGRASGMSEWAVDQARAMLERQFDMVRRARDAGVRIAAGSDTGSRFGAGRNAIELVLLAASGLTPAEVIVAATETSAAALGWSEMVGTITPGKRADIVLVDQDPLSGFNFLVEPDAIKLIILGGPQS